MKSNLRVFRIIAIISLWAGAAISHDKTAPGTAAGVPKEKQTVLGLYVTAEEAYEMWKSQSQKVVILDVRTPEEYIYVGHAEMAHNIPFALQTYRWDENNQRHAYEPNRDFITRLKEWADTEDTICVMCRSGGRSAMAINKMAESGFTKVYNIIDGMEGDAVEDPASIHDGKRIKNGWKNSRLPWTYRINPEQMHLPLVSPGHE